MFGEAISFDYLKSPVEPKVVFGHFSIITASLLQDGYFITADKDSKIRVARLANLQEIESFCLGHTSYVSHLGLFTDGKLVSASGDGFVRIWDPLTGEQLHSRHMSSTCITSMHVVGKTAYVVAEDTPDEVRGVKVENGSMSDFLAETFREDLQAVYRHRRHDQIIGVKRSDGDLMTCEYSSAKIPDLPTTQARCLYYKHTGKEEGSDSGVEESPSGKRSRVNH
jgi:WD40 repeat protein